MEIAIVGAGRVGTALGVAWARAGHVIVAVAGRAATPARAARWLPGVPVEAVGATAGAASIVVLGVPDDALDGVVTEVARSIRPGTVVVHLSGALGLDVLEPVRRAAGRALAVHPLQTFADVAGAVDALSGCAFAVTADDHDGVLLGEQLARDAGGVPFVIADADRPLYHAAAVFASNYLVVVSGAAEEILSAAGVSDPRAALRAVAARDARQRRPARRARRADGARRPGRRGHRRAQPGRARGRNPRSRAALRGAVPRCDPPRGGPADAARPRRARGGAREVELIRGAAELSALTHDWRDAGDDVGLVPTMGALHPGHRSLIARARAETARTVVSIFVNPLQFDDDADLARYPRDEDADLTVCRIEGVDAVWAPAVEEVYPLGVVIPRPDPGDVGDTYEGAARPGHFAGVLQVVHRIFTVVGSCDAFFGEKDAQQLFLVRRMATREPALGVRVIPCPTVRAPDGLALSSRNDLLSAEERADAPCLFLALTEAAERARAGEREANVLVALMAREIGGTTLAKLEYAAVVDEATFEPVGRITGPARAIVAARFSSARLIDNLPLPEPA